MTIDTDRDDVPLLELIERMRLRLLDLSGKNRLLNYRHPRGASLRIVHEVPTQVFETVTAGGLMVFKPLWEAEDETHFDETDDTEVCQSQAVLNTSNDEEGTQELSRRERRTQRDRQARILAERRGINPSFDLLAVRTTERPEHQDGCLQTLLFPDDLEERLRKIQQEAITALQETGANTLHLMFGFLEWHDVPESQLTEKDMRPAPLVLVPATLTRLDLDKQTRTFSYAVAASRIRC
jgi:hypothetical protein